MRAWLGLPGAIVALLAAAPAAADAPKVVASIVPVHSLVASVMQGIGAPALLVRGGASPHDYALRPSDARALAEADLVVWVGETLESFLGRTLESHGGRSRILTLQGLPGLTRLPVRESGAWAALGAEERHAHGDDASDPHVWLDPGNARAIAEAVAAALAEIDPGNAAAYRRNAAATAARLAQLSAEIAAALAPVKRRPHIVFHDAYQYFEHAFGTNAVGAITLSPERQPGAQRLKALRRAVADAGVVCAFAEPGFDPGLVQTVIAGMPVRTGTLDAEGATLRPGPDAYFVLMRGIADALRGCLAAARD